VVAFLDHLMQTGKIPNGIDYTSPISLLLAGSPFWKETVFDPMAGGISRIQVNALFLSLTPTGITHLHPFAVEHQASLHISNNGFIEATISSPFYKRDDAR
jgi:hypothetical protein